MASGISGSRTSSCPPSGNRWMNAGRTGARVLMARTASAREVEAGRPRNGTNTPARPASWSSRMPMHSPRARASRTPCTASRFEIARSPLRSRARAIRVVEVRVVQRAHDHAQPEPRQPVRRRQELPVAEVAGQEEDAAAPRHGLPDVLHALAAHSGEQPLRRPEEEAAALHRRHPEVLEALAGERRPGGRATVCRRRRARDCRARPDGGPAGSSTRSARGRRRAPGPSRSAVGR